MSGSNSEIALSDIHKMEKLGEGTYGVVYKARHITSGRLLALKKIRSATMTDGISSTSIREISILKQLSAHPNIVRLESVIFTNHQKLYMVFEFLTMDLKKYMDSVNGNMDPMLIKSYIYQISRAIEFCHSRGIVHRDLKPQNLLIDGEGLIKIADFGLARALSIPISACTHEVVTMYYRCPEVLLGAVKYSHPIDVWSLGCIFAEMTIGRPIFRGDSEIDQLFKIFQVLGTPKAEQWPEFSEVYDSGSSFPKFPGYDISRSFLKLGQSGYELFKEMVIYDPTKRISARRSLQHSYFCDFDSSLLPNVVDDDDGNMIARMLFR